MGHIQIGGMAHNPQMQGISININSVQFFKTNFTDLVESSLQECGYDPRLLILEIHEETLASNPEESISKIDHLRSLGVRFSLDRFGAGQASITLLRKFNIDEIKISLGIIARMISYPKDAELVQTLIKLAQQMEIDLVAVGVENEQQFHLLRDQGCRLFQGHYFGRPQPAERFAAILNKGMSKVAPLFPD